MSHPAITLESLRRVRFAPILIATVIAVLLLWLLLRSELLPVAVRGPGSPRLFPAVLLAFTVGSLAIQPAEMWLSRRWEREADRFSLELTGEEEAYVATERNLATRNLSDLDPGWLAYRFLFTHPAPPERIAMASEAEKSG